MASRFASRVKAALRAQGWTEGERVLAAVSGGADSLALLFALAEGGAQGGLVAAYIDHGLRPEGAQEAAFVAGEARAAGAGFREARIDGPRLIRERGRGLEEAARYGRYQALLQIAREEGAAFVATGHTADDQAETVLMRLLRGGSLGALSAMPEARALGEGVSLVRPMLALRREEARRYLLGRGRTPLEDPSNASLDLTRNRVRKEILPLLQRENPRLVETLAELAGEARRWDQVVKQGAAHIFEKIGARREDGTLEISAVGLSAESGAMREEVVRYALGREGRFPSRGQLEAILRLLRSEGRSRISLGGGAWACREGGVLRIAWRGPG